MLFNQSPILAFFIVIALSFHSLASPTFLPLQQHEEAKSTDTTSYFSDGEEMQLVDLPTDLLMHIQSYLANIKDMTRFKAVNRVLNSALDAAPAAQECGTISDHFTVLQKDKVVEFQDGFLFDYVRDLFKAPDKNMQLYYGSRLIDRQSLLILRSRLKTFISCVSALSKEGFTIATFKDDDVDRFMELPSATSELIYTMGSWMLERNLALTLIRRGNWQALTLLMNKLIPSYTPKHGYTVKNDTELRKFSLELLQAVANCFITYSVGFDPVTSIVVTISSIGQLATHAFHMDNAFILQHLLSTTYLRDLFNNLRVMDHLRAEEGIPPILYGRLSFLYEIIKHRVLYTIPDKKFLEDMKELLMSELRWEDIGNIQEWYESLEDSTTHM